MSLHYFHCTNGVDMIVDRHGARIRPQQVERVAACVAGALMAGLPAFPDWSDWLVNVYDSSGSVVAIVPFSATHA
ncbi:DUF6894 family protein [Microvirga antarctica]|uniref:DUF6894 family protein n=1 Tax=Microvirga antarctica TaxID=2819233 RepID=UPI001B31681D|nr:hypothetical protein [Microvirga antarctica]